MSEPHRGALIVIEGLDRAGKTTQCERLYQRLKKDYRVKRMKFPDRLTPIGSSINDYLKGNSQQEDHVIHLLFSANRWEAAAQIRADINQGVTIVIDRYYYSGIVYSAAKNRTDLTIRWARQPEIGLPMPDLCLFLDISPDTAANRGGFGHERYERDEMQKRVRALFHELLSGPDGSHMRIVDAGQDMEKVSDDMLRLVDDVIKNNISKPLGSVI